VGGWYGSLVLGHSSDFIFIPCAKKTDASRFGQAYLAKFGWDASKGLGVSGEGRTSAVKATQKLDMLGIGMRQQSDHEGGIAWRQNRDFEDLLRRLNDGTTTTTTAETMRTADSTELLGSFHKARERESEALEKVNAKDDDGNGAGEEEREGVLMAKKEKKKKKKKKKKRKAAAEEEEVEEGEGLDRKGRKKRRKKSSSKDDDDDGRAPVSNSIESEPPPPPHPSSREAPPREESGSVPMGAVTATATRPTAVTAPIPVRAPYVAMYTPLREPKD
jgi:Pin2-interacting protein X1